MLTASKAMIALSAILTTSCAVFGIRSEEGPEYEVLVRDDAKEIRKYAPYIVAKVNVSGSYREAQSKAFRILANYIFGANQGNQSIAMTAPVMQSPEGTQIPMTSPVMFAGESNQWTMAFMMPSSYSMKSLPMPEDERITFEEVPQHFMGVLTFSWWSHEERYLEKGTELAEWLSANADYGVSGKLGFAGYDPPWTLPFLRRNEVWLPVKPLSPSE